MTLLSPARSPSSTVQSASAGSTDGSSTDGSAASAAELSSRIVSLLSQGMTIARVAKKLGVHRWRVDAAITKMQRTRGCKSVFQLMWVLGLENGLDAKSHLGPRQRQAYRREYYRRKGK